MSRFSAKTLTRRFLGDRRGNFGMMSAILLPIVFGVGGVAIDMAQMVLVENDFQEAADAASLAAATALVKDGATIPQAKAVAREYLKAQSVGSQCTSGTDTGSDYNIGDSSDVVITQAALLGNAKRYEVEVSFNAPYCFNGLTRFFGKDQTTLGSYSKAEASTEAKNALSMYFVLDRSGSMREPTSTINASQPTEQESYDCGYYYRVGNRYYYYYQTCYRTVTNYIKKIEALKSASAQLLGQLSGADPTAQLVRTGGISYSDVTYAETPLAWGTTAVSTYINALIADGGTDSGTAFKTAYQKLTTSGASSEDNLHRARNGQVPTKFIVFMTDGDNNYSSADTETKRWCDQARAARVEVYTVAFMAPDRGRSLLSYCATSANHYFRAEDAAQLTAAFKYIGERATELTSRLTK
ncbi:VWA domain-containing protein [Ensifer soli]|uniref:VWA domain-containing protein n=1 Tax=Ciceribacter sp. sgz301302 TaxID=3342379 RepID=UPI0035B8E734